MERAPSAAGQTPTPEAIAREVGVGIGAPYRHYPTPPGADRGGLPHRGAAKVPPPLAIASRNGSILGGQSGRTGPQAPDAAASRTKSEKACGCRPSI
ncbi:hypothetical protein GCM10009680_58060 [Streptomyces yatensis]|uniref:HTH tetR-type domain-containing protein n=1 Tax=Streptomyces yatensis TaxID=155177 RepID=A0ABP4UPL8_9ACTN